MKLKPGDILYYQKNLATGLLLDREEKEDGAVWKYCLRSPTEDNRSGHHLLSVQSQAEAMFIKAIKDGTLSYYES